MILGQSHIYQRPTARKVYESGAFDPEGIVGCLPTLLQVLLGVQAGMILLHHAAHMARIKRWLTWSAFLVFFSFCLCGFSLHGGIPINKNLWSLSFVFLTAGLANLLLATCYFGIDVVHAVTDQFNPFLYPGMNSIILYVGHTILHLLPWHWRYSTMNSHFLKLSENTWNTLVWVVVSIFLYERKIFYSV